MVQRSYVLDLVLVEVGYLVHDEPRQGPSKVYDFMHYERQDSGGEYIILHESVPCRPETLKNIEMNIVLGNLVELTPVRFRWGVERESRRVPG